MKNFIIGFILGFLALLSFIGMFAVIAEIF